MRCSFVPAYVLQQLANAAELGRTVDSDVVVASRETLRSTRRSASGGRSIRG